MRSARLIENKLMERGMDYPVKSLIMPYGSGYTYKLSPSRVHIGIVQACHQTNIEFAVGIAQGRAPLNTYALLDSQHVVYVGRLPPAYVVDSDGRSLPYADLTVAWLSSWYEDNCALAAKQMLRAI